MNSVRLGRKNLSLSNYNVNTAAAEVAQYDDDGDDDDDDQILSHAKGRT